MSNFMQHNFDPRKHDKYYPTNKEKYRGEDFPITRSSYESKFCRWLDMNESVLEWASECLEIQYFDPTMNKVRRYYPDFYMKAVDKYGNIKKYIIEIKPYKETHPPRKMKRKNLKSAVYENITWSRNQAKWKAADNWCKKNGYEFRIITEKQLFK